MSLLFLQFIAISVIADEVWYITFWTGNMQVFLEQMHSNKVIRQFMSVIYEIFSWIRLGKCLNGCSKYDHWLYPGVKLGKNVNMGLTWTEQFIHLSEVLQYPFPAPFIIDKPVGG